MKILFVCIGNICRSPIAEGVFNALSAQEGASITADSAGTHNYHVGETPHSDSIKVCAKNGIAINQQRARQITATDLNDFDYIYTLATDVHADVLALCKTDAQRAKIKLLLDVLYPRQNRSVKDPWYGDYKDYEDVFTEIQSACKALLHQYKITTS